ncbi:TPA: DMT family transporter [Pseudomonas aeruginosa]|nr:EamA family transporter [Pseudomonas aeruginosa]
MEYHTSLSTRVARVSPIILVVFSIFSVQIGTAIAIHLFHAVPASGAAFYNALFSAVVLGIFSRNAKIQLSLNGVAYLLCFGASIAGMFLTFFYAVERIPMAIGSTIEFMGPLALSVFFARRPIHFLFILLAISGVVVLMPSVGSNLDGVGVFYAVLSAAFWALFILLCPKVTESFHGESGLALGMAIAAVIIFPFAWLQNGLLNITLSILFGEFLMALFSTIIPLSLEYIALRLMSARSFGVVVSMEPVASALVAFAVLAQPIYPRMAIAIIAVTIAAIGITLTEEKD